MVDTFTPLTKKVVVFAPPKKIIFGSNHNLQKNEVRGYYI
jgi:hypothetical protein